MLHLDLVVLILHITRKVARAPLGLTFGQVHSWELETGKYYNSFNRYWLISTNPDTSKKISPSETYAGVFYGPTKLIYEDKLKFELGEKKFILY